MVRFFKSFYAKKVFTYDVMSCITLDVTLSFHRGVYCSHGDAPEGAVLEERFFGDRRPKFVFWGPECTNIWKRILSNFGAAFFYLVVASPKKLI